MNKHEELDLNELIRDYSDSSASEAPEQMVVNVNVPGMFRMGKKSGSPSAAGSSGGSSGGNGRGGGASSNNHSPSGLAITQNPDYNQRSMQIRAFSQLVAGSYNNNSSNNNGNNSANGGQSRKRPRVDNQQNNNNNNNNNSSNINNNYYTLGGAGNPNKILIKPSHGVPASKLPNLGRGLNSGGGGNSLPSVTAATLTATSGTGGGGGLRNKLKPPPLAGATITKNSNVNSNSGGGFKEKLSREETVEIWRLLARAIYSSNVPVSILENEHWVNVMQKIQPTLILPSTSVLSNALLEQEYSTLGQEIEEKVEKSHFSVLECVTVPGSRPDEVTLVFYLNCDDSPNPYLYKTHRITSASDNYTKDNLSKIIEDTILDIGLNKVVAFMSDLNPEMEATWEILRDKFPGLLTFGCVIYGLNSILDKILNLSEIGKMVDVIKKLYNRIEKSQELRKIVEEVIGKKHISPYDTEEEQQGTNDLNLKANGSKVVSSSSNNGNVNINNNNNNNNNVTVLNKWKLTGRLISQLISEKAIYQQILGKPDSKRVLECLSSDSPSGKSDRSLSNHLSSESFWTSLHSLNSITVPCLQWIDALKPDRDCSLSEVPEVFKELKVLLQTHVRNFPVDDTTKQSVQKHFLQVERRCVNEIHFTGSLLNPSHRLRGVLTEDEEAQGMEFLTYFCDSRGYHAGSILRELADYKSMNGAFATEKIWKLGQTLDPAAWWKMVQAESALSNIAISLGRVVPSCSIPEQGVISPDYGDMLDADKSEKLGYIQYNLKAPSKVKLPRTNVVVMHPEIQKPKLPPKLEPAPAPPPPPPAVQVPAKIEKLRIKIPKKEDSESPAIDLSARLSGCSQVSDEEDEDDDDDSGNEESTSNTNSIAGNDKAATGPQLSPPPKQEQEQDDDQSSDDGSTKDGSSSDSDDSSSDDQSD